MSFFNLTMLGYQDPVRGYRHKSECMPDNQLCTGASSQVSATKNIDKGRNSYLEFTDARMKHARVEKEPYQQYCRPITTSQEVSWWRKDAPVQENLPWTHVKKHVFAKSEMTSFVDKMVLADKSFRLY